jgi:hypothetical protein
MTDFMASGGDGYTWVKGKPVVDTGLPLRELLIDTVRRKKVISAVAEGRVLRNLESGTYERDYHLKPQP